MSEQGQATIAAVRRVAAERPNKVVRNCVYTTVDRRGAVQPECLVGHGLWDAGLIDELWAYDNPFLNTRRIKEIHDFGFDPDEVKWLNEAQVNQDAKNTWAHAVWMADNSVVLRHEDNLTPCLAPLGCTCPTEPSVVHAH